MTLPVLLTDGYKLGHRTMYPEGIERVLSNLTARSSRVAGQDHVCFFGLQFFLQRYLEGAFQEAFFDQDVDQVCEEYERRILAYLGPNSVGTDHIRALHELGYLPLEIRAFPEGSRVPIGVPMLTIENTHDDFAWLVNYLETLLSCVLWMPITSATTASRFRSILDAAAARTGSPADFVNWQGHDFSFRGMHNPEDAALSSLAHLLFFTGTDTIPALGLAEDYYGGFPPDALIGGSVPATEHSVMCAGGKEDELDTFRRLLAQYPTGILSVVSDTWDLWHVCTEILPALKDEILARDGKLVIRPDSGDPVKIVVGDEDAPATTPAHWGVVEALWDTFGGTETASGHRLLDSHIGVIYGDGINEDRLGRILAGLRNNNFASGNVVFGLGSYTYAYVTRDTYGMAVKATWCQVNGEGRDIFKDPITDLGGKRSAVGRLAVVASAGVPVLIQQAPADQEAQSLLRPVWRDGQFVHYEDFQTIRARVGAVR